MAGLVQESDQANSHTHHSHHVKFSLQDEEFSAHHENLEIIGLSEKLFNIHLGYLKVNHYYKVSFTLDLKANSGLSSLISKYSHEKSSKNITFKEIKENSNGSVTFLIVFFASKEKLDTESIFFISNEKDDLLTINFEAKVLGTHQGTPLLRNGITLLAQHQLGSSEKPHFNIN